MKIARLIMLSIFAAMVVAAATRSFILKGSSDLVHWTPVSTNIIQVPGTGNVRLRIGAGSSTNWMPVATNIVPVGSDFQFFRLEISTNAP